MVAKEERVDGLPDVIVESAFGLCIRIHSGPESCIP